MYLLRALFLGCFGNFDNLKDATTWIELFNRRFAVLRCGDRRFAQLCFTFRASDEQNVESLSRRLLTSGQSGYAVNVYQRCQKMLTEPAMSRIGVLDGAPRDAGFESLVIPGEFEISQWQLADQPVRKHAWNSTRHHVTAHEH